MSESEGPKPKINIEQLKQLMAMQQGANKQTLTKRQAMVQQSFTYIMNKFQRLQHQLDRFINFVTKKEDSDRNDVIQAARSPILFGTYVVLIFIVVGGLWTAIAPLNSAVVVQGIVISSTNKKLIQHQEGGIVKNIFVKQGDHVKQGDKLVEIDDTKVKSQYENVLNQYRTSLASEARLIAERDWLEEIEFPELLQKDSDVPEVEKIMQTQENLFRYRKEMYRAEKDSLKQKVLQLNKQIEGLESRKVSAEKNLAIIADRLKATRSLKEKGFAAKSAVLSIEAEEARYKSELSNAETEISKTHQEITRTEIENINIDNRYISDVLKELKDTQVNTAALRENFFSLNDSMKRSIVTSPVDGIVNVLYVHTLGGVVSQGGGILEISPTNDVLVIEAKVPHRNIDSVHLGLVAKIRFSAFKSRTTPLFTGKVTSISPDTVQDRNAPQGEPYYIARIEIDMDEFNKIAKSKKLELHPGMMSEVQIITGTRTLLRYLLDPVTDTMFKAFREK